MTLTERVAATAILTPVLLGGIIALVMARNGQRTGRMHSRYLSYSREADPRRFRIQLLSLVIVGVVFTALGAALDGAIWFAL